AMRQTIGNGPALGLALLGALMFLPARAAADEPPKAAAARKGEAPARLKARLDVARKGFEESMTIYRETKRSGQVIRPWQTVDQVYSWSRRWLDLDCAINANKND